MKDEMKKNGSGCYDPTAYKAIKKVDKEYENYFKDKNGLYLEYGENCYQK